MTLNSMKSKIAFSYILTYIVTIITDEWMSKFNFPIVTDLSAFYCDKNNKRLRFTEFNGFCNKFNYRVELKWFEVELKIKKIYNVRYVWYSKWIK